MPGSAQVRARPDRVPGSEGWPGVRAEGPATWWLARSGLVLAIAVVLVVIALRWDRPLAGHHLFRQAHVAANVETFVASGLSLVPRTYNFDAPFAMFDFPAYEVLVAALCRLGRLPALPTARVVSGLLLLALVVVLARVLAEVGIRGSRASCALLFVAASPLVLFYSTSPIPDGLALLFSALSLWAFVRWDAAGGAASYLALAGAGALAALVKSPVYLPVFLAVLWVRFRRHGLRGLVDPAVVAYVAFVGATVVWFKLFSNAVNGQAEFLTGWEEAQYFGPLRDRLNPAYWWPVVVGLGTLALNPLTFALVPVGAMRLARRGRGRLSVVVGLLVGSAITLGVFFSRCRVHSYYLLPFVFPLAIASAVGLAAVRGWFRRHGSRRVAAWLPAAAVALTLVVCGSQLREMSTPLPWIESRGRWIQERTDPRDFVVYVVTGDEGNWNPEYLYFAKRDGYNLWRGRLTRQDLATLYVRFAATHRALYVFSADAEADAALDALGAPEVAADRRRRLYRLEPGWIWRRG